MGTSPRWRSRRRLHGRPVAVLPYPEARTCVISANAAAKRLGVGTGTDVDEARRRCPGIALVSQRPDLYVRVQRRIGNAVNAEIPIDAVCSVDELCCVLGARDGAEDMGRRIKARLREAVGPRVTCSMGVVSSRWLAKVASAMDKPDGLTVLDALPGRLLDLDLEDLSPVWAGGSARGGGARASTRCRRCGPRGRGRCGRCGGAAGGRGGPAPARNCNGIGAGGRAKGMRSRAGEERRRHAGRRPVRLLALFWEEEPSPGP